ncbi:hemolysin, partial [Acinetobacter baumannii]
MKKFIFLGLALVSLSACSSVQQTDSTPAKIG